MSNVVFGKRNLAGPATAALSRDPSAIRRPDAESAPASSPGAGATSVQWNWRLVLFMLAFPAVWLGMIIYQGPALVRDYRLAASFRIDPTVKITKAHCTSYWFTLKTCSVDYEDMEAQQAGPQSTNFMVAFTGTEGFVIPMRSTVDRNAVTTQVALDLMTNRVLTFLALTVGMLMLMIAVVAKLARSDGDSETAPSPQS